MTAVALVGGVLVLESWPVLALFRGRFYGGGTLSAGTVLGAVAVGAAAVAVCAVATWIALRVTRRRIEGFEF
jgi:hypothetical protein